MTQIRKEGMTVRLLYFLFNLAMPTYLMYVNLYFRRLGFSGTQIGFIVSIYYLANFLCQPLWGYISDRYRIWKPVLVGLILISSVSILMYLRAESYSQILLTAALLGMTFPAIMPIADATAMDYVKRAGISYGSIRLWGSLGFMTAGLVVGQLTGIFGLRSIFVIASLTLLIMAGIAMTLPTHGKEKADETANTADAKPPATQGAQVRLLLKNRQFAIFLVASFLIQGCMAMGFGFLNIYISSLGAQDAFIGLLWAIAAASEIPAFLAMAYFQKKLGARGLLLMSYTVMAFRWILFSLARTPYMMIPVQLIQGFSGGYYFGGSVMFVSEEAPEGLKATAQTIFGAINMGLGPIAGMTLGGQLVDRIGLVSLFVFCGIVTGLTAVLFALTLIPKKPARNGR